MERNTKYGSSLSVKYTEIYKKINKKFRYLEYAEKHASTVECQAQYDQILFENYLENKIVNEKNYEILKGLGYVSKEYIKKVI